MQLITPPRISANVLLMSPPPAAHADSKTPAEPKCDDSNTQWVIVIKILDEAGNVDQPAPCLGLGAHVQWLPVDPKLTWVTAFPDNDHESAFPPGHAVHHNGSVYDHDYVKKKCVPNYGARKELCSYKYGGFIMVNGASKLIDPKIIINPNARREKDRDNKATSPTPKK